MTKNKLVKPFLKWAGGKRQLIGEIRKHAPKRFNTYFEPFLGGGAVLFDIQPKRAVVNDINGELVNTYEVIRNHIEDIISDLSRHKNERDYFYTLRELDRQPEFQKLSPVERASRLIFLNKTCFNDICRLLT